MLNDLRKYLEKPDLNAQSTVNLYRALWEDEHISKGMLQSHLNPNEEGATFRHEFVFKSVQWITELAPPPQYNQLLDLGCGPGIYAECFKKEGYSVTGVDFSKHNIRYAKEQAIQSGSNIQYHYQDYLTLNYTGQFDVITLINKDYAVLSKTDRMTLLEKVYQALKPGGKFIFDVMTPKMRQKERSSWFYSENSDFFSDRPHLLLEAVYQYDDDDKTELRQQTVITDDDVRCFIVRDHFFTKESLLCEFEPIGFCTAEFYDDIAGKEYSGTGDTICGVFTK